MGRAKPDPHGGGRRFGYGPGMRQLADGVFTADAWIRFYGVRLQTRMAVVRLRGERLLVYSPIPLRDTPRDELARLGAVRFVVSPNKIHNQTLDEWRRAHPDAELLAPPGLAERRPELRFDGELGPQPDPRWAEELDQVLTGGNVFFSEALLFQRQSGTLLVGDFVENLDRHSAGPFARALARAFGVRQHPMASPEFRFYTHDAEAARAALERARAWPIERIFLCHGALIETEAAAVFDAVCEDLLAAAARRRGASRWLLRRLAALQ